MAKWKKKWGSPSGSLVITEPEGLDTVKDQLRTRFKDEYTLSPLGRAGLAGTGQPGGLTGTGPTHTPGGGLATGPTSPPSGGGSTTEPDGGGGGQTDSGINGIAVINFRSPALDDVVTTHTSSALNGAVPKALYATANSTTAVKSRNTDVANRYSHGMGTATDAFCEDALHQRKFGGVDANHTPKHGTPGSVIVLHNYDGQGESGHSIFIRATIEEFITDGVKLRWSVNSWDGPGDAGYNCTLVLFAGADLSVHWHESPDRYASHSYGGGTGSWTEPVTTGFQPDCVWTIVKQGATLDTDNDDPSIGLNIGHRRIPYPDPGYNVESGETSWVYCNMGGTLNHRDSRMAVNGTFQSGDVGYSAPNGAEGKAYTTNFDATGYDLVSTSTQSIESSMSTVSMALGWDGKAKTGQIDMTSSSTGQATYTTTNDFSPSFVYSMSNGGSAISYGLNNTALTWTMYSKDGTCASYSSSREYFLLSSFTDNKIYDMYSDIGIYTTYNLAVEAETTFDGMHATNGITFTTDVLSGTNYANGFAIGFVDE